MRLAWNPDRLSREGYKINERNFSDVKEILRHIEKFRFQSTEMLDDEFLYSGAEHTGKPKLPNVTYLPNIPYTMGGNLFGSTFGHQHTQKRKGDTRLFQEIYEFQTCGAMLLRSEESTKLLALRPGEKVIVRTDENMTLFNLDKSPLITIDYANPEMNSATKDLEKRIGPLMAILKTNKGVCFSINSQYREEGLIDGKRNSVVIWTQEKGEKLLHEMEPLKRNFEQCGIELVIGSNLPNEIKQEFAKPLSELVYERNKNLLEILQIRE